MAGCASFCVPCVQITCFAGVFLFIVFGIFTFSGFKYFELVAEELGKGPFKNPKHRLGTEFFITAVVYLVLSLVLYFLTRPKQKIFVQTPEEEKRANSIRETIRTFSSGEIVDQLIRDNKLSEPADGALFPEEKDDHEDVNKDTPVDHIDQTPNLLEEQIISKKEEEPTINPQNEKLVSDVGPILGEESKQENEVNNGTNDVVPLISNEENQS